jgi:amidase
MTEPGQKQGGRAPWQTDRRAFLVGGVAAAIGSLLPRGIGAAPGGGLLPFGSAVEAAAALRRREVSSVELLDAILGRIERHNPALNAIVTLTADSARARAVEADRALARGEVWGPLHGVPMTIKDTFETAGVRTTAGATFLSKHVPERDAVVVDRVRRAGAVLLGKTNVPPLAADWQSYNDIFGRTNNPWNLEHTPGGSSGGCAAALAAGLSFLSVGSDIGGSIRIPAAFCGLYGHKPSINLVPLAGHIPPPPGTPPGPPPDLPVAGPLARSAADLRLLLEVLAGPSGDEAKAYRWTLPAPRRASLAEYRVRYVVDDAICPVTGEVRRLLENAVAALRDGGAKVEEGWPKGVDAASQLETYLYLLWQVFVPGSSAEEKRAMREAAGKGDPVARLQVATLDDSYQAAQAWRIRREAARAVWREFFSSFDAFLSPVTFVPAVRHDPSEPQERRRVSTPEGERNYMDLVRWIGIATMTGCPATAAPVGTTAAGLPVGIQIMGPLLEDATPIDLAGKLAAVLGGFRPPPGFA